MEQFKLLASNLDDAREVLRCVINRMRSARSSALWESRSTKSMYMQTAFSTRAGWWLRLREAALRLLIVICRPLAPGIVSEGWRAQDRSHVVVIVRLTRLRFIDPIKTLVDDLVTF